MGLKNLKNRGAVAQGRRGALLGETGIGHIYTLLRELRPAVAGLVSWGGLTMIRAADNAPKNRA
ncbi:hypothetical protein GCM10011497_19060 [Elstera cyanobacteriorum]|nr:hypothetical protein GCM10011497_19060 [Elstera cyanobacteriorum]